MVLQKKILVVEDNQINRMMLCGILSAEYQVLEAENGLEALSLLKEHKEEIALILLDIVMPVMDGYTFLSHMKADPAYASIPVIVTTQKDGEPDEVTALSHGATDFVTKPYKPQVILHRVAGMINLRETAAMINQIQYDRLTGLYNKEFFYQRVRETLLQNPGKDYDIICSDIENFKLVNDIFGVSAGNRLLCGIADMYTRHVGKHGICGRFHADQFVCLVERQPSYTDDLFAASSLEINEFSSAKNVTMKWGIYAVVSHGVSVEQMCDRALLAARSIKGQYGKYFAMYDDTLRDKLLREQAITDGMEAALMQGQFEVYLQPKYRIRDDRLAGAEALVRWDHPEWGLQSPAVFIPLFEKNGFITRLDQFVWEKTCAVLQEWEKKGYPAVPVSVNVSRADIYNADIAEILMKTVTQYGLSPSRLHLEITESAYTENPEQIINTVTHLRELGFVIEMDDFGSGYSSLNMLNKMPLDILKLDMKFIQSETAKPVNQGILRFIMGLARWMNLSVVAEGVETKEQLVRLREIGCDYVQGYYFAKPMPLSEFESLISEHGVAEKREEENTAIRRRKEAEQLLLVVDEDAEYRSDVRKAFKNQYQVVELPDINSALARVARYEQKLAAIILSLTLPEREGFSILELLQREKTIWNIPVIATGPIDEALEERALNMGADDYAAKPHRMGSLLRRVQRTKGLNASWNREKVLRDEAYQDYLTGLLNRRGLKYALESLRKEDMPAAFFLLDLDNLKQVNDTYGHAGGDRFIKMFSDLLRSYTRATDFVCRYGGDEFAVVMKQMGSAQIACKKGEEICRAIRESCFVESIPAAASAGIVLWDYEEPLEEVFERADAALYRAKAQNKGGCCLWEG